MRYFTRNAPQWARTIIVAGGLSLAATAGMASPVTVTFNEAGAPAAFTQLDGTTFYQAYGIADFTNAVIFGPDARLPDDGHGIYNYPASLASVLFSGPVYGLSLTWVTAGSGQSFYADVFGASHTLLGSYFFDGTLAPGSSNGVASFAASGIYSLEFHDGGQTVAIDTLSFSVPEPVTIALFGAGLAGAASLRRRKKV